MGPVQSTRNNPLMNYAGPCARAGAAVALVAQGSRDAKVAYTLWKESRTPPLDEIRPVVGSPVQSSGKFSDGVTVQTVQDVEPVGDSRTSAEETSRRAVSHAPNQTGKKVAMLAVRAGVSFVTGGYLAVSALRGCVAKKA